MNYFLISTLLLTIMWQLASPTALPENIEGDERLDPLQGAPEEMPSDEEMLTQSDQDRILEPEDRVSILQQEVAEIARSSSTLDVVAKNPSSMTKVNAFNEFAASHVEDEDEDKARNRRNVDSPTAFSTSVSTSNAEQPSGSRSLLDPYSWLFSDAHTKPEVTQDVIGEPNRPSLQAETNSIINENSSKGGVIYIRWGSSQCPAGAEIVYVGTAAGAHYSHAGSGSNYLCLPHVPIYDEVETTASADRAILYSSEYQTSTSPDRLRHVHDHTPTCVVCRAPADRANKLMVPARNVCPSGEWRLEYAGYLMAERYSHHRSEFICMDRTMEAEPATHGNQDGALFYMVEARCLVGGGLPCRPYVDGWELTCAVCTI